MSLDVFCLVILLFFLFGLAVSASEDDYYYYPRKLPDPWKYEIEEDKDNDSNE
tara:strand:- start:2773 stop:2931 length:159 start_codon:yes stop_codon:yes gene_type:complete